MILFYFINDLLTGCDHSLAAWWPFVLSEVLLSVTWGPLYEAWNQISCRSIKLRIEWWHIECLSIHTNVNVGMDANGSLMSASSCWMDVFVPLWAIMSGNPLNNIPTDGLKEKKNILEFFNISVFLWNSTPSYVVIL